MCVALRGSWGRFWRSGIFKLCRASWWSSLNGEVHCVSLSPCLEASAWGYGLMCHTQWEFSKLWSLCYIPPIAQRHLRQTVGPHIRIYVKQESRGACNSFHSYMRQPITDMLTLWAEAASWDRLTYLKGRTEGFTTLMCYVSLPTILDGSTLLAGKTGTTVVVA